MSLKLVALPGMCVHCAPGLLADPSLPLASVFSHFASGSDVKILALPLPALCSDPVCFQQESGLVAFPGGSGMRRTHGKEDTIPLLPRLAEGFAKWDAFKA